MIPNKLPIGKILTHSQIKIKMSNKIKTYKMNIYKIE